MLDICVYEFLAHSVGLLCLSSPSQGEQVLHSFKEEMARKNDILQSSKNETIGSTYEGSAKASVAFGNQSTRVITRSMTRAPASIILKQTSHGSNFAVT